MERGVWEGSTVGEFVGKRIDVGVAAGEAVGEGSGLDVQVGVSVAAGGTMRRNPPQAMSQSISAEIQTKKVLLFTSSQRFDCVELTTPARRCQGVPVLVRERGQAYSG